MTINSREVVVILGLLIKKNSKKINGLNHGKTNKSGLISGHSF